MIVMIHKSYPSLMFFSPSEILYMTKVLINKTHFGAYKFIYDKNTHLIIIFSHSVKLVSLP
jgi:hypothetical protein